MSISYSVGQAFSVEARDAVAKAVYEARISMGSAKVNFAIVIASVEYDFQAVFNAAKTQIGDIPMIGVSTTGELTNQGSHRRSVVVALIEGEELECQSDWQGDFSSNSVRAMRDLLSALSLTSERKGLLMLMADGLGGDYDEMLQQLPPGRYKMAGCLAGGDLRLGRTHQFGGNHSGYDGLAGAFLESEELRVGIGSAHGWHSVGASFEVSGVGGKWVRSLDGETATDGYAKYFGRPAKEWRVPPLNTLVRLYPLGVVRGDKPLMVRSPLHVEADGSLRMNASLSEGETAQLMIGSREKCIAAARQATQDALAQLAGASPKMALVFADISWQMLFQGFEGAEVEAIREVIGDRVPIAGGYTFGQLTNMADAPRPEFLNQHIEVILFA